MPPGVWSTLQGAELGCTHEWDTVVPSKGGEYVPVPVADHRKADVRRAERGKALGGGRDPGRLLGRG